MPGTTAAEFAHILRCHSIIDVVRRRHAFCSKGRHPVHPRAMRQRRSRHKETNLKASSNSGCGYTNVDECKSVGIQLPRSNRGSRVPPVFASCGLGQYDRSATVAGARSRSFVDCERLHSGHGSTALCKVKAGAFVAVLVKAHCDIHATQAGVTYEISGVPSSNQPSTKDLSI